MTGVRRRRGTRRVYRPLAGAFVLAVVLLAATAVLAVGASAAFADADNRDGALGGADERDGAQESADEGDGALESADELAATASAPDSTAARQSVDVPDTLEGTVTTRPVHVGDRVVVGTDRGVYAIADGSIERHVETRPVRRLVPLAEGTAIALVDDRHNPNVLAIDVASGEVDWRHARERGVYSRDFGQVDRQVPAFDAAPVGDVTGDGTPDVALTAGRAVLGLDGASGDPIWTADRPYNVWSVAHADGTVYAGTQGGRVVAVDAASGDREYATRVAEPFENDRFGSIPRSVWDVEPLRVGGAPRLAVTTEVGEVLLLERDDGDVAWRESLIEWDDEALGNYYAWSREREGLPTYPGDGNFRNVQLAVMQGDDGRAGLAVRVSDPEQGSNRAYQGGPSPTLYGFDAATGEATWTKEDLPLAGAGPIGYAPELRSGSLLVPLAPEAQRQRVLALDPASGEAREPVVVPSVPPADRHELPDERGYVAVAGAELVVASSLGDVVGTGADGEVRWSVPSLRSATFDTGDLTGDGVADALVTSEHDLGQERQSRVIAVRDGTDGSVVWARTLDLDSFFDRGGYVQFRPVPDGSGGVDIVALRQPVRDGAEIESAPPSQLLVWDGATGERLAAHDLVNDGQYDAAWNGQRLRPTSLAMLGDVDDNGNVDVLVGAREQAFALDVRTGEVLWEGSYDGREGEQAWQPVDGRRFHFHAVGGADGRVFDVAVGSADSNQLALLEADASGGELTFEPTRRVDLAGSFDPRFGFQAVGDRTGDGYVELSIVTHEDDPPYKLYDPAAGRIVGSFETPRRTSLRPTDVDLTGDGQPATVVTQEVDERARVSVLNGVEEVWSQRLGEYWMAKQQTAGDVSPAAPAGDVTGDGTEELALATSSPQVGARVEYYDVETGERVETLELASWEDGSRDRFPALRVERIPDQTGDGEPELGVVAVPDQSAGATPTFYVVDPQAGEVLVSGEGVRTQFVAAERGVGIVQQDGSVTYVDVTAGVTVEAAETGSPLELSWSFDEDASFVTTVAANDRSVALTTERSASLRLPPGTHTVSVEATRPDGVTIHDSVEVEVAGGSSANLLLYLATLAPLLVLVGFGAVPAIRRRVNA